jgi:hypothetical protein
VAGSPFAAPNLSTSHPTPTRARQLTAASPPHPGSPDTLQRMRACRSSSCHGDPRHGRSSQWASGPTAWDTPWTASDQPSTAVSTSISRVSTRLPQFRVSYATASLFQPVLASSKRWGSFHLQIRSIQRGFDLISPFCSEDVCYLILSLLSL